MRITTSPILEQLALGEGVAMLVHGDQLVVRSKRHPRSGWDEQSERMAKCGDDRLLEEEAISSTR